MYITPILEFSRDPISDTTPTWTDITAYLLEAKWGYGIDKEADDPRPGQATFVLDDRTRRFEPDYAAGAYYPDIVPMRRFRWRITSDAVTYDLGIWYAVSWQPGWPDRLINQETTVECVDGSAVLALDDLPTLDPPDATSYPDVVNFDEPWLHARLGEQQGTRSRPNIVVRKWSIGGDRGGLRKFRFRRGDKTFTKAEAGAVSGPTGTYKNTPTLGVDGLVLGDQDTAVHFGAGEYVQFPLGDDDLNGKAFTLEALVKPDSAPNDGTVISGPPGVTSGVIWSLFQSSGSAAWGAQFIPAGLGVVQVFGGTPAAGVVAHLAATWDGQTLKMYVDGVLVDSVSSAEDLQAIAADPYLRISHPTAGLTFRGVVDEVAIYEHALTAERISAHFTAATARGYPQQTAGERIAEIITHPLWGDGAIQIDGRQMQPTMQYGQARLEEVAELAHGEGPTTLFYFDGEGIPKYAGHAWQAGAPRGNTVQATVGNGTGETPYEDIELVYDDEVYNDVTANALGGELVSVTDATSQGEYGRRSNSEWTDVLLVGQTEVESLANHVAGFYSAPAFRPVTVDLNGDDATARVEILERTIGDLVRVLHRPKAGTAIDRVCHIIGVDYAVARGDSSSRGQLTATWNLSRGFNGGDGLWHAGVAGFSEAGVTTVAS